MNYISTRGKAPKLNFEEVVLTGLASDGGLYVPEQLPQFSTEQIASWADLSYTELAFEIFKPFVDGEIEDADLKAIIDRSYQHFSHKAIAPLVQLTPNQWVLELFHGPTLAFKDFALQFLGQLLDFILSKRNERVMVLGATSGDTGSAAIEGCRHCENIDVFILHPHQRVSEVQRRQMTTVIADNVHNIAVEGNFDDCQSIVKACFRDQEFLPDGRRLVAVNSINWARIMAQITYYFYSALALGAPHRALSFAVPTGNFGDIFAGYLANQMGLPVDDLIIATNQNDILHRCLQDNDHSKKDLHHSLSPSMDIMVSSNFERLLFDLYDRDGNAIEKLMTEFESGSMRLSESALSSARQKFKSVRFDDAQTVQAIRNIHQQSKYLADPHSAIGVAALNQQSGVLISLATAHPAKFQESVERAVEVTQSLLPQHMQSLLQSEERYTVVSKDLNTIKILINSNVS